MLAEELHQDYSLKISDTLEKMERMHNAEMTGINRAFRCIRKPNENEHQKYNERIQRALARIDGARAVVKMLREEINGSDS